MIKTLKLFLLIIAASTLLYAQEPVGKTESKDLTHTRFESVSIKNQGVRGIFSRLAFSFDIPVGLELARTDTEDLGFYKLDFKGGSLSDLMTGAIKVVNGGPNRYAWEIKDGAVYVFPEEGYRDPILNTILQIEVPKFHLNKNTGCRSFVQSLAADPDVNAVLGIYEMRLAGWNFSGFYIPQMGREFTFEVTDISFKAILDKSVKESPIARFWVIGRNSPDTFLLSLSASFEDTPKEWTGFQLDDFETETELEWK